MKYSIPNLRVAAAQHGFTLIELLVATTLGSVVLASLGGVLLVSEMKVSANIQRNLDTKDSVNRAIDLMRREAALSSRIDIGDLDGPASLTNCLVNTPLILVQRTNSLANPRRICYKTLASSVVPSVYGSNLKGPCVLIRQGPPYKPNGDLYDTPTLDTQILLEGVTGTAECAGGFTANVESSSVARKASLQIKLASGASYDFDVQIPSNLSYEGINLYRFCKDLDKFNSCKSDALTRHYLTEKFPDKPSFGSSDSSAENIFYFINPYSDYALSRNSGSGICTYTECFVRWRGGYSVQLSNVDALIFPDKEIRPTR